MATTTNYGWETPDDTDAVADGALAMRTLGSAIDTTLSSAVPAGAIQMYAGTTTPTGWLSCDGQAVSRATYAALFAAIGTTYGAGDGSTTFNLPDTRGRVLVGVGTLAPDTYALGAKAGEARHTLTQAEMPSHTHTGPSHTHGDGSLAAASGGSHTHALNKVVGAENRREPSSGGVNVALEFLWDDTGQQLGINSGGAHTHDVTGSTASGGTGNTGATGSGGAHENRPPYLAVKMLIKT